MSISLEEKSLWKIIESLDEAFTSDSGKKGPASLAYLEQGWRYGRDMHFGLNLTLRQIRLYLYYDFLHRNHKIYSYRDGFDQQFEGTIELRAYQARDTINNVIMKTLEERFKD